MVNNFTWQWPLTRTVKCNGQQVSIFCEALGINRGKGAVALEGQGAKVGRDVDNFSGNKA